MEPGLSDRRTQMASRKYPFNSGSLWNTAGFEEAFWTARALSDASGMERYLRYATAARSLSPCWWWYGSDKRWTESPQGVSHPALDDKGELCLGPTTVADSLMVLSALDRDSETIHPGRLRMAFGGLLGVWALVRDDGAGSMGFCPDAASKHFGMSWTTGDLGLGLYHYLRGAASFVLASRQIGLLTFGCEFESLEEGPLERFILKPWDGVGRRVVVRHVGLDVSSTTARIKELAFDARKRNATLSLQNTSDKALATQIEIRGLWGERFEVDGAEVHARDGILTAKVTIEAQSMYETEIRVIG
jgi:hypothetical protein